MSSVRVSVIIPAHNDAETLHRCLSGLGHSIAAPYETIVVADGAGKEIVGLAEELGATVIQHTPARGPAYARNRGAWAASGDVLFFLDSDCVVHPDTIPRIAEAFGSDVSLDGLIGSYDDAPASTNFLSQYRNLLHHYVHQTSKERASTFWGACGAIRREVFLSVGGFDERYVRPSIEDIELGYRLQAGGHQLRLRKDIRIKHLKRWTASSIVRTDFFCRALPWTELLLRDRRFDNDLNLKWDARLSVVSVFLLIVGLLASFVWPVLLVLALASAVTLLFLNAQVYGFFRRKRGLVFSVGVIPWHWLLYVISGLAFAVGLARHLTHMAWMKGDEKVPIGT